MLFSLRAGNETLRRGRSEGDGGGEGDFLGTLASQSEVVSTGCGLRSTSDITES